MLAQGKVLAAAFGLALAVALFFAPSSRFGFVAIDDQDYVTENERVKRGLSLDGVTWAFSSCGYASNWHPLAWISLMADATVAHRASSLPKVMHLHNVLLHAANAAFLLLLMIALLRRLSPGVPLTEESLWACLLLSLLWAVHPLRMEVVCWVSERKELLSVFFMLSSLLAYVTWRRLLALPLLACALLAKPVAVTLPAVFLAWDWCVCGRVRWGALTAAGVLSAGVCVLTMAAQSDAREVGTVLTLAQRTNAILGAPVVYLCQTVLPQDLSFCYARSAGVDGLTVVPGVALLFGMAAVCLLWKVRGIRACGVAAFFISWCYVGLLPMLGIVKVGSQEHSDRYTYWIGCGLAVLAAHAVVPLLRRTDARRVLAVLLGVAVSYSLAGRGRMAKWRDTVTLFRDAVSKSFAPEVAGVLANELLKRGGDGIAEAEHWLRESATRTPTARGNLELAAFLLVKPMDCAVTGVSEADPYLEAEWLLKGALEAEPDYERAQKAMKLCKIKQEAWRKAVRSRR